MACALVVCSCARGVTTTGMAGKWCSISAVNAADVFIFAAIVNMFSYSKQSRTLVLVFIGNTYERQQLVFGPAGVIRQARLIAINCGCML